MAYEQAKVYRTNGGDKLVVASGGALSVVANSTNYIWTSKGGSDTVGDGSFTSPYATVTKALAAVTATRTTILVMPGTYAEAAALVWPTISGVKLIGLGSMWQTTISAAGTSQVIGVAPGVQTESWEMWLENIYIDHGTAGQDGLLLDNTGMDWKLNCYLRNVGGDADSASDKMLTTVHGDADNAIRVYWSGDGGGGVEGCVEFVGGNDGDRLHVDGVELNGGLATSDTAVALDIRLRNCVVLHEGISGGNAAQTLAIVNCFSQTGGTYAVADAGDVAGSQTASTVPDFST
ncbi:MAG: DUF1565 domain-containing protein [Phycisphaerae bacterium]|nr:DUF1565 domain-containing protein [Phycisphaerae bacterium]